MAPKINPSLFRPVTNDATHLKAGVMGFASSGKTFTATCMAIGMKRLMMDRGLPGAEKPIMMVDTEGGRSWVKPMVDQAFGPGNFHYSSSPAFSDLGDSLLTAEAYACFLIVDSISTIWVEFCETYAKVKERKRGLEFTDWNYLKTRWRNEFIVPYLNTRLHCGLCGRAGYEYEHFTDEAGKKQIEKSGIKMKSEAETGYEPSLVVLMDREMDVRTKEIKHVGHILKDRRTDERSLDGKIITNPTFDSFMPHIEWLNLGGEHNNAVSAERTSAGTIAADEKWDDTRRQCKIICEEINGLLAMHGYAGTAGETVAKRCRMMAAHFGTTSKAEIEERMPLHELRERYNAMHRTLEKKPSRYFPNEAAPDLDDAIPDFGAAPEAIAEPESTAAPAKRKGKKAAPTEIADRAAILAAMINAAESAKGDSAARIAAVSAAFAQHADSIALLSTPEQMTIKAKRSQLIGGAVAAQ